MSAYLGPKGLERLREQLSERDLVLIRSVADHRFLTAHHVECLHFYDHATEDSGARVCRRVLARLTRDRLLVRLARRVGGVRAGSASFVYALGPVGVRLLSQSGRLTEPSPLFLDHTLAVADAHVRLRVADRVGTIELLRVDLEPTCWRRYLGPGGVREIIRPDLYAITASGEFEHLWWLEIDRGTESPAALTRKMRAYEAYWRTGTEQSARGTFPVVAWVARDVARAQRIQAVISRARNLNKELFRSIANDGLTELIAGGAS